jgi:hypothetical protein
LSKPKLGGELVLFILISMVVIVAVAALVVAFVAFPHRGEELPGAPWLGESMNKLADVLPTLEDDSVGASRAIFGGRHEYSEQVGESAQDRA